METVKRSADLCDEFKGSVHLLVSPLHRVITYRPWKVFRARSERIAARAAEGVPVCDGKSEMFVHRFLANFFSGVVKLKSQRVIRRFSLVFYLANAFKILFVAQC